MGPEEEAMMGHPMLQLGSQQVWEEGRENFEGEVVEMAERDALDEGYEPNVVTEVPVNNEHKARFYPPVASAASHRWKSY